LSESSSQFSPTAAHVTSDADEDERLVRQAQQGSLDAFNQLVTRHERIVFSVCLRILRDASAAEDATQDTFVKAWTSISTFQGWMLRPWLLRIATNRCYDVLRAQRRRPAESLDAAAVEVEPTWSSQVGGGEDPEGFSARNELSAYLEKALGLLPEDQHVVVVLSDIHGYGYDDIAGILDIPVGTVKSRISRGRAKLRQFLSEDPATREHFAALWRSIDG
jgi:RNA polymerase sigma-70 factor (ECF subfamily)